MASFGSPSHSLGRLTYFLPQSFIFSFNIYFFRYSYILALSTSAHSSPDPQSVGLLDETVISLKHSGKRQG